MKPPKFQKVDFKQIIRWIGTIIAFILLIFLVQQQGWDEIRSAFVQVSLSRIILALTFIFLSRFAVVCRWHVLLHSLEDVSFWQTLRISFAGLFAANFLPTTVGGDVVRLAGAIQLKINGPFAAASLIVDRLIGMLGMVCALPFGLPSLRDWFNLAGGTPSYSTLGASITWVNKIRNVIVNLFKKVEEALKIWVKHPESLLFSYLFTFVHMTCLFLAIKFLLDDLGGGLSFGLIAGLWSFVYFITLIPVSINGYGVQELSIAFIFSEVGGIPLQSGITISILLRLLMIIGSLPGSVFLPGIIAGSDNQAQKIDDIVDG